MGRDTTPGAYGSSTTRSALKRAPGSDAGANGPATRKPYTVRATSTLVTKMCHVLPCRRQWRSPRSGAGARCRPVMQHDWQRHRTVRLRAGSSAISDVMSPDVTSARTRVTALAPDENTAKLTPLGVTVAPCGLGDPRCDLDCAVPCEERVKSASPLSWRPGEAGQRYSAGQADPCTPAPYARIHNTTSGLTPVARTFRTGGGVPAASAATARPLLQRPASDDPSVRAVVCPKRRFSTHTAAAGGARCLPAGVGAFQPTHVPSSTRQHRNMAADSRVRHGTRRMHLFRGGLRSASPLLQPMTLA